jgi:hypothetical protein
MEDNEFDTNDAIDATHAVTDEAEAAAQALERGPGPAEVRESLSRLEDNASELSRVAEAISDAVGGLSGSTYSEGILDLLEGADDAYEHLNVVRDRAGIIEKALQGEKSVDGTLDIDGRTFEVTLTPVMDDDGEDSDEGLGELFG